MSQMKIPYGISDYKKIKDKNCIYVDKTQFIKELEEMNTDFPVFLRPRRFGKTLFVSTLFYYYDLYSADEFDSLFGDTYIGSHKTELANQYYVMRFDFSSLDTTSEEQLRNDFYEKVHNELIGFCSYYQLDVKIRENTSSNPARLLDSFLTDIEKYTGKKIYILIDEYDQFANNVIGESKIFNEIVSKDGFVRRFYEVFKLHAGRGCIDRIFITGVTSITLDSLTSGFNISKNISMRPEVNTMVGFTKEEIQVLLEKTGINEDGILKVMEDNYNGYLFHHKANHDKDRVFNSNMVLYFLDEYLSYGQVPDILTDPNIMSDYKKLTDMFQLFSDAEQRSEILQNIMEGRNISANIVTNFSFTSDFNRDEFLSMLFYLGLLTIKKSGGVYDVALQPPNAVIRDVYYQYYAGFLKINHEDKLDALNMIAFEDNFDKFNALIIQILKMHSNDDYRRFDEARLKSVFLSCLSSQNIYLVKSEYESEGRKADIVLFDMRGGKTNVKYSYLIELKYLKKGEASEDEVKALRQKAYEQMQEYLRLSEFKNNNRIKGIIYVVAKDEILCCEEVK